MARRFHLAGRIAFCLCCALQTVGCSTPKGAGEVEELRQEIEGMRRLAKGEAERLADEIKARTVYALKQAEGTDDVVLRCDYGNTGERGPYGLQDVLSIGEKAGTVRLMSVDPPRPGTLSASDGFYRLEFPENQPGDGYLLLKVTIDRLTAKAERVIGRDQAVIYRGQTQQRRAMRESGECVRMNAL